MSSDNSIERNKKNRAVMRSNMTKLIKKIEDQFSSSNPDKDNLEESLAILVEREAKLTKLDEIILEQTKEEDLESEIEHSLEYSETIIRCKTRMKRCLQDSPKCNQVVTVAGSPEFKQTKNNNTKLPRLTLEKYDGDVSKFQEFWPQFTAAIHENDQLKEVEKFTYLKSLLADSASKAISGLPLTGENYQKAVEILINRYGKKDILISTHMNILLSLEPVLRASDTSSLRKLHDEINIQIRCLETLDVDFNSYGSLLLPILFKCLPSDLVLLFNRNYSAGDVTVSNLLLFVEREVEAREKSLSVNSKPKTQKNEERRFENDNRGYPKKRIYSAATLNTAIQKNECDFCLEAHLTKDCNLTVEEKIKALYRNFKCRRCLKSGHKKFRCKARWVKCRKCNSQSHLEYLCTYQTENAKNKSEVNALSTGEARNTNVNSLFPHKNEIPGDVIYYQTLRAEVVSDRNPPCNIRILCDSASERSYVSLPLAEKLDLSTVGVETLKIYTFGATNPSVQKLQRKEITLRNPNTNKSVTIQALETKVICSSFISAPSKEVAEVLKQQGFHISDIVGDSCGATPPIDILLGNDFLNYVLTGKMHRLSEGLVLYESIFGWTLSGRTSDRFNEQVSGVGGRSSAGLFIQSRPVDEKDLSDQIRCLWEIESLGITDLGSEKSECAEEIIRQFKGKLKFENGRYEANLIWKRSPDGLKNNFELAKRQFNRVKRELKNDTFVREQFKEIIKYQSENSIIRECGESEEGYFMPFRAVVRRDKESTQVRMVFNCSSSERENLSLNDCLDQGPNLNPNVLDVILSFRKSKIGFCGDIEKAFLMIGIAEEDRKYLKFLWFPDDESEDFKIMQMNRVCFGCNCSPFLLSATIKHHIGKYSETNKDCFEMLNSSLYADDLCSGADSVETAFKLSSEAVSVLSDASFNLRKLNTNSRELHDLWVQNGLSVENRFEKDSKLKVLGLVWNLEKDVLRVDVASLLEELEFMRDTKRSVLSVAARIFDPVGFISPFIVRIKILMQKIWEKGLDWDAELPGDLQSQWKKWCEEIKDLDEITIPRHYFSAAMRDSYSVEVHIFCDSSIMAYGTVAYFRWENGSGEVDTSFIMSKSRVAPLRKLSLPRLELMGALIAARLSQYLARTFQGLYNKLYLWTDSEICLHWIKGSARDWKQFVSNRVLEIQNCASPDKWNHCPGIENPADKLTRGETVHSLKRDNSWWHGPPWLKLSRDKWPQQKCNKIDDDEDLERRDTSIHAVFPPTEPMIDETKFSSYGKLLRIFAWVKRFIDNVRRKSSEKGSLTASEMQAAEEYWIKKVQSDHYPSEIELLKVGKPIPPHSKIYSLAPYLDDTGTLRVRGRLEQADLSPNEKHPAILPKSKVTDLMIMNEHVKSFHSGVAATLASLRNRVWIPKGRQVVKRAIHTCLVCRRFAAKPAKQMTGQLPRDRIVESPPFTVVGVDFTGAITIKTTTSTLKKVYIVLFTCAVTRAVHLEVTSDMSAKSLILAMRRFLSRRGSCRVIFSDNAKSFRSACEIAKGFRKVIVDRDLRAFITSQGVTWKFIPERSPWWGGFWERLMHSIKVPLRKTLGKALLTLEELTTVLSELECVLNNRPLTYDPNDLSEPRPLTPSQFLMPGRDCDLPEHFVEIFNKVSNRETLTRRRLYQSRLLKQLWVKWKEQYLLQLRNAHNFINPSREHNLKSGDIVLVEGTAKSKLLWDMGVIEEVIMGRDGLVRACTVRTNKGLLRRSIPLLYPLEIPN